MSLPSVADSGATVAPSSYPEPHLKRVLRTYQSAASNSLSGPNGLLAEHLESPSVSLASNPGLLYYGFASLPLPVVAPASARDYRSAGVRVKSEPQDDKMAPVQMAPVEYDAFKLWKLKQPACYAIVKDKDACVDLSAIRSETAQKPRVPSPTLVSPPSPQPSFPILSAPDRGGRHAERGETLLEGQPIACFSVGGEPRLCLPQILNTALYQFHHEQIGAVCDELQINCSRCTAAQLDSLKAAPAILPRSAASCGLITKSDAQRLCSALLRRANPEHKSRLAKKTARHEQEKATPDEKAVCKIEPQEGAEMAKHAENVASFRVYHQCFGKCEGVCRPAMYTSPEAACIECVDCGLQLSPFDFVSHAHRSPENRTCHWGFDAAHWRAYLLLARRQPAGQHEALVRQLDELKSRFSSPSSATQQQTAPPAPLPVKRKFQVEDMLKPSTKASPEAVGVEQQPFVKRYKDHLVVVASGGRQSPYESYIQAYAYAANGQYAPARESPPLLQEAPSRGPHLKDGQQPNVALLAPPRPAPARPAGPLVERAEAGNPEIELSSTDTDDSDSMHSQNGDGKTNWDLPAGLANEVNSVEELLRRGGCDASSSRMVLQAFRRLAYRVSWAEEKQQRQQEAHNRSPSVLKLRTDLTDAEAVKYKAM